MKAIIAIPQTVSIASLDQNPAAVYLASIGAGSRRTMRDALNLIAELLGTSPQSHLNSAAPCLRCNWAALRFQHTSALRARLIDRYAPSTANKMLAALRGVLKAAWRLGYLSADDYHRARDVQNVTGARLPAGRAMTAPEIRALLDICAADLSPAGVRDGALIALLRAGGLRREELRSLSLSSFDPVNNTMTLSGKGNKERLLPLAAGARTALDDWLGIRGSSDGPLFCPINKKGDLRIGRRLTTQSVYYIVRRRAILAGVKHFTPHDFRRTFISDLLDAGADISTVQRLAGHESVVTTQRYDRRGERTKRAAVELLDVPYTKRT